MVQKNEDGTLSIYTFDWFPIIVKSLQELNDKVDEKLGVSSGERIGIINTNASLLPAEPKTINTPTVLNYRLPSTFKRAQMLLYSFDGKELADETFIGYIVGNGYAICLQARPRPHRTTNWLRNDHRPISTQSG